MDFVVTDSWREAYPGAVVGTLLMAGVANPPQHPALKEHVRRVEAEVRARHPGATRASLAALPVLQAYRTYYKRWDKTYHLQIQLESVVLKGKPLGSPSALVEAMFAAEINNLLLTAGHDPAALDGPITLDVSPGGEVYTGIGGREVTTKAGDMLMRDGSGIISSVLHGPDQRTRLTEETDRALFTVYAPDGIGPAAVRRHLEEIAANVRLISPPAEVVALATHAAL